MIFDGELYPGEVMTINTETLEVEIDGEEFISFTIRTATLGDIGSLSSEIRKKIINKLRVVINHILKEKDSKILLVCQTEKDKDSTKLLSSFYEDE